MLLLDNKNSAAQKYCNTSRFDTVNIFSLSEIDTLSLVYGYNTGYHGNMITLRLFLAYPSLQMDTFAERPLVLLIHGGSFINGTRYDLKEEALYFARKGFVSASIDYRLGWQTNSGSYPANCLGSNVSHTAALYRAVQDAKAALRFLSAHASLYKIDNNNIIIGGSSAGAFTSLATQYMTESDFYYLYPQLSTLGAIDSADNSHTDTYSIKGIMSVKGALFDTSYIKYSNQIPAIFFHGTADPYYPYNTGPAYNCSNYFTLQGSGVLSTRMEYLNGSYELNYKVNGNHGNLFAADYILDRRALFIKRVLCDECRQIIVEDSIVISDNQIITSIENDDNLTERICDIFPNPVGRNLTVEFVNEHSEGSLRIFDENGRLLYVSLLEKKMVIDMSDFPSGAYFFNIECNGEIINKTIIKE